MNARNASLAGGLLALSLGLAACGPKAGGEAEAVDSKTALVSAATDSCAVCDHAALAPLTGQIKQAMVEAAADISPGGVKILADNQKQWLETQRIACGVAADTATLTADQQSCFKGALSDRVKEASGAVEKIGGYTFQRVELNKALPITAETAAAMSLGPDAPMAVTRDIAFPRIDGDTPEVRKFNAAVAQNPRFKLEDQTDEATKYKISYAGPGMISVRFDMYDYTVGAAHPNTDAKAITVLMKTGAEMKSADVFKAKSGWEDFLARRAVKDLDAQMKAEDDMAPPVAASSVRNAAIDPEHWLVTEKALIVLFPPNSIGPFAMGGHEVAIPWAELKPYLNPAAPVPIGAG